MGKNTTKKCKIRLFIIFFISILFFIQSVNGMELKNKNIIFKDFGMHKITFYCNPYNNLTASGTKTVENRTVAVDLKSGIKFGDRIYLPQWGYFIAEDTGRLIKNKRIDIYVESCNKAKLLGVKYDKLYIVE